MYSVICAARDAGELRAARAQADTIAAYYEMVQTRGGIYVRRGAGEDMELVGRYSGRIAATKEMPDGTKREYQFHQKTAKLATEDFASQLVTSHARVKAWIAPLSVSPIGTETVGFDRIALKAVTVDGVSEFWQIENGNLRYARAMREEDSPKANSIISVAVPHQSFGEAVMSLGMDTIMVVAVAIICFAWLTVWLLSSVLGPVTQLAKFASRIATARDTSDVKPTRFDDDELTSGNEVHVLSGRLGVIYESMWSALTVLEGRPVKTRVGHSQYRDSTHSQFREGSPVTQPADLR